MQTAATHDNANKYSVTNIGTRLQMPQTLEQALKLALSGANKTEFKLAIDYLNHFEKDYQEDYSHLPPRKTANRGFIESAINFHAEAKAITRIQQSDDWTNHELTTHRGFMAAIEILNLFKSGHFTRHSVLETLATAKGLLNRALYYAEKPDIPNEEKIIRLFVVTFANTYQKLAAYDLKQAQLFARKLVTNLTSETTPIGDVYEINPL